MSALSITASPGVSIIIPAWRLTTELAACLDAIAAQQHPPQYEVIVVVNGGDPAVAAVAENHPLQPTVRSLPVNVGFGRACNLGASMAKGADLVFLNDDTVVAPQWLAALVKAGTLPGVGAVVSLLLDLDGATVLEAGARIVGDAEYRPFGIGQSISAAQTAGLLTARAVEYGSGAALLISAALFHQLGGFDSSYAPAYYEDTDLEFRIRAAGYQIWFEPAARVRHYANHSTKDRQAFREFASERSRAIFLKRWKEILPSAAEAAENSAAPQQPAVELHPIPKLPGFIPGSHSLLDGNADPQLLTALSATTNAEYVAWLENHYLPRLENQIGQGQQELNAMRKTISWRLTRPLRALRQPKRRIDRTYHLAGE